MMHAAKKRLYLTNLAKFYLDQGMTKELIIKELYNEGLQGKSCNFSIQRILEKVGIESTKMEVHKILRRYGLVESGYLDSNSSKRKKTIERIRARKLQIM